MAREDDRWFSCTQNERGATIQKWFRKAANSSSGAPWQLNGLGARSGHSTNVPYTSCDTKGDVF